jgi:hypothetical protein
MVVGIVCALVAGLLTFTLTVLSSRRVFTNEAKSAVEQHVGVWHQDSMYEHVDREMKEHETECPARRDTEKIKTALIWMVVEMKGNPKELGLIE